MIYLKKLPFVDTFDSMREVVEIDNLANLKKHLSALHSWVPSHYRKADYTLVIDASFVTDPLRLLSALPTPEQKAVMTLVGMKVDEYLTWSLEEDEELMMQTLHLVISYEDGDQVAALHARLHPSGTVPCAARRIHEPAQQDVEAVTESRTRWCFHH